MLLKKSRANFSINYIIAQTKSIVELAEKYLQLNEKQKMFIIGVMQGILLSNEKKSAEVRR